jgi:hypothetical protein
MFNIEDISPTAESTMQIFHEHVIQHIEMLAAAFLKETDLSPQNCRLVAEITGWTFSYRFEKIPNQNEILDELKRAKAEMKRCMELVNQEMNNTNRLMTNQETKAWPEYVNALAMLESLRNKYDV